MKGAAINMLSAIITDMRGISFILFLFFSSLSFSQTKYIPKKMDSTYSYVDSIGNIILKTDFDYAGKFKCNLARVNKGKKWGFIDTTGKIIVPLVYDYAYDFSEGFAVVETMKGCDDENMNPIVYRYKCKEKYGLANTQGKVTMTKYSYIENFKNGYARVYQAPWWKIYETYNINWFYIDRNLVEYEEPDDGPDEDVISVIIEDIMGLLGE